MNLKLYNYEMLTDSATQNTCYVIPSDDLVKLSMDNAREINNAYAVGVCLGIIFGVVVMALVKKIKG